MNVGDLITRAAQVRTDLHALEDRIKELTDDFDLLDHRTEGATVAEVIDSLSDARLDLNAADRHLETVVRTAERLSTG
ncbi:hypothetical protein [Rhodococcus koreensis]|uniref:Uncharacterized protein n=1 Tax=Rhodococcus koreensis TaxID=99653 RepID=A0A1H4LDP9_9NOCA|nr:hypothetical protein [Rhodococcus koreensis]SEB68666.1 hypothetical protein SAMN04490239_1221 [Rhodococcus koreensis]